MLGQVVSLWRNFKEYLIQDYVRQGRTRRDSIVSCIAEIEAVISTNITDLTRVALGIRLIDEDVFNEQNAFATIFEDERQSITDSEKAAY